MTRALLFAAGGIWLLSGAGALLPRRPAVLQLVGWLSALGGLAAVLGGCRLLVEGHALTLEASGNASRITGQLVLRTQPLAGAFIVLLGVIAAAIGLYLPKYHHPGLGTSAYLVCYQLALVASLLVLLAGNVPTFLVAWESMALTSFLLVLRSHTTKDVPHGAFWFLGLSEVGFAMVIAAFAILATQTDSLDFGVMADRIGQVSPGARSAAYVLALLGFGFKAGLVPLHVWLPEAHPVAPSDGSAFLSGMIVKLGVFGILLFALQLDEAGPAWWGLVTMGIGAASAVLGILYALTERDLKRFLAFSTVENVGIIMTTVGAAMTFGSEHRPHLAALLLVAALFHVGGHGVSKALLFLEAGVVDHATGTRDMDRLGGLVHRLPKSTMITLIGVLGIAALPPLCGFVSEWLIFQGMFQAFRVDSHPIAVLIVAAAATLGLTGGLAVAAFIRFFGIPFLGMPRTRQAAAANEHDQPVAGPALLAVAVVALGVGAPAALLALARAARTTTGISLQPNLVIDKLTIVPAHTNFAAFSPTYLAACLLAVTAVPLVIYWVGRPHAPTVDVPVWDGGIREFKPRLQYSAMTFSAPERVTFSGLYRPTVHLERSSDEPAGRSGPVHYEAEVDPVFERILYRPIIAAVQWLADFVRPIQSGDVNLYLLYVFVAVIVAYAVALL